MTDRSPRVALFADSFYEVNGVALTCRMLDSYARRNNYPMLSVHAGQRNNVFQDGSVTACELRTSPLAFGLERDLRFDMLFARHMRRLRTTLKDFGADLVHVTGPSHLGMLGAWLAHEFGLPLVASWHTNVHEYAGRRLRGFGGRRAAAWAERESLSLVLRFYGLARRLLAPNLQLVKMLQDRTGKPCSLMRRGVDCEMFHPSRRRRTDKSLVVGYVGRLSAEKSVKRLAEVERALADAGVDDFRIEIAGHGGDAEWLRSNIKHLSDLGVLRGTALAEAYAGFDIFAFPSETDTYGNVVQEAMASGVPCVVTDRGGPAEIVTDGVDGFVAGRDTFCSAVTRLALHAGLRQRMAWAARRTALDASWDAVFRGVYDLYADTLGAQAAALTGPLPGSQPPGAP